MRVKKLVALFLCVCMCFISVTMEAKPKRLTGKGGKHITWNYDNKTKTMIFSGKGSTYGLDECDELDWEIWSLDVRHLVIKEGISEIGHMAFYGYLDLRTVELPDSLKKIDSYAFDEDEKIKSIKLPSGLEYIGDYAFSECIALKECTIPSKVKYVGMGAFSMCDELKNAKFLCSLGKIDEILFWENLNLSYIKLPTNLKTISKEAFCNCKSLKKIDIPKSVRKITMSAFAGSGLKKIILPENVEVIKNGFGKKKVFQDDNRGTGTYRLPTKNLRVIEIRSKKIKRIDKNSFAGLSHKLVIKVPKSRKKKYTKMIANGKMDKMVKIKFF